MAKILPNNTQIAIAFIENGTTKYYGIIKESDTIRCVENKDKVFEIGSISKVFTSTLLADAVLDKRIGLEDDINRFYDFTFNDSIRIDFISLSNHTSGLEGFPSNLDVSEFLESEMNAMYKNPFKEYDEIKLKSYLKNDLKFDQTAEKEYNYSNLGVGLLGYTLGVLHGSSYEELLADKIFEKYGMTNSYSNANTVQVEIVNGLDNLGNFVRNWEWDSDVLLGAGGILSTVADLAKFANAQFDSNNKELALTRIPTFTVNENVKVCLGWHIIDNGDNQELYWHNGGTGGYSSSMALDMDTQKGVVILSNVSIFNPEHIIDTLCFELVKTMK
jgi:CubicO group peptidase (beta-lactamase class C family)